MNERYADLCHGAVMTTSDAEVEALEARLAAEPADVEARVRLVGAYFLASRRPGKQVARGEHLAWLARNRPDVTLAGYGTLAPELAPEQHAALLTAWRAAAVAPDVDLVVLHNAASFIGGEHPEEAAALYQRAIERAPDAYEWRHGRARRLIAASRREDSDRSDALAAEAVRELEAALCLTDVDFVALGLRIDMLEALQLAERWDALAEVAARVLADNETCERTWQYGNAVHDANLALGWCAYLRGDHADAAVYLVRAGQTPGSPQLDSFGPDFELARAVLSVGKRDAVLAYIEACSRFWEGGEAWLTRCYELVAAGATKLPDGP